MQAIIKQIIEKIKDVFGWILDILGKDIVFFLLLIIFSSSTSFLLGSLSEYNKQKKETTQSIQLFEEENKNEIYYVASKNGSRYYLPWCYTGLEKNKVTFFTVEEAENAGYTPAKNCDGL